MITTDPQIKHIRQTESPQTAKEAIDLLRRVPEAPMASIKAYMAAVDLLERLLTNNTSWGE